MRYIHIHIIPHSVGKKRYIKLPIEFVLFSIFMLIFLLVSSAVYIKVNIKRFVSRHKVEVLSKEIKEMESFKRSVQTDIDSVINGIDELNKNTEDIVPMVEFATGVPIKKDTSEKEILDVDSLYQLSQTIKKDMSIIKRKIEVSSNELDFIPSIMPVNGWISVPFGKIKDPMTEKIVNHYGITISSQKGESVKVTASGIVKDIGKGLELGKWILVDHENGFSTLYAHLDTVLVKKGDMVKKGDIIGKVGNTGRSVFYSLYYEIRLNGKLVNPQTYILDYYE